MKLIELKVAIIKDIVRDENFDFGVSSFEDAKSDNTLAPYINNLNMSINEAISRLVINERVKYQSFEINMLTGCNYINKDNYESDFSKVSKIKATLFEDSDGNLTTISFVEIGNKIRFERPLIGIVHIIYIPKVEMITDETDNNLELETIGLDNYMSIYIINFVKATLFEQVDPEQALNWKAQAETYMKALLQDFNLPTQSRVVSVVGLPPIGRDING